MVFRLVDIKVSHFRGFGDSICSINLDGNLALFYGPNGFGKTSLAEAIEWLLYGSTKRRKRGDSLSKTEYKDTYPNVHKEESEPVMVTATILAEDGRKYTISRQMYDGSEESFTLVDGRRADFRDIGVVPLEDYYPVVAQHELQSFILTQPKKRRDEISAAFGLGELTPLKTALYGAYKSLSSNPPDNVQSAKKDLLKDSLKLNNYGLEHAKSLHRRWKKNLFDIDKDWKDIVAVAEQLTERRIQEFKEKISAIESHFNNLDHAITSVIATNTINSALLDLWESGLTLAGDMKKCPMCEEQTLTEEKKKSIRKHIPKNIEAKKNKKTLRSAITAIHNDLNILNAHKNQYALQELNENEQKFLSKLLPDEADLYQQFNQAYNHHLSATEKLNGAIGKTQKFITELQTNLASPERGKGATCLEECKRISGMLNSELLGFLKSVMAYQPISTEIWGKVATSRPVANSSGVPISTRICGKVATAVDSKKTIKILEALKKIVENNQYIKLLTRYDTHLQTLKQLTQDTENRIKNLQNTLSYKHGSEIKKWYDMLNPYAGIRFEEIQPGTEKLDLYASSYGVCMPAAANLSECQLNCLGLAMWVMRATSQQSPFGFIVFDDPVQTMDDDHTENFIAKVIPSLIDGYRKQVVVLSHAKSFIDRLEKHNSTRSTKHYRFDNYDQHGPQISLHVPFKQALRSIEFSMNGDENERKNATKQLRELAESIMIEIYDIKKNRYSPERHDRGGLQGLLKAFSELPGISEYEVNDLRDTINFSNPAHHANPDDATPVKSNIQPHYDRLKRMIDKYDLS